MNKLKFLLVIGLIIGFGGTTPLFSFQMDRQAKVRAPELTGGKGWLNTDQPLSIAGLKGKMVLLDFWTYGCINCIHIIPDLKRLEGKYPKNLVVIGVHSAKFENEKDTDNIRRIILRYGLEHPVVNDADFNIWDAYAIRAWPGRVLIDPAGYIIGTWFGEGRYEEIDSLIEGTVAEFRKKGGLSEEPLAFALERAKVGSMPLAFPGKVLADEKSDRLYIADSNHNRIVITDLKGKLIGTIGNGMAGTNDGDFGDVKFNKLQGMALGGDFLFVADTDNHSIRRVDLKNKTVQTIAGTGSLDGFSYQGGEATRTPLRSPWDLSLVGNDLFIAMAGSHQIWRLDLIKGRIAPYAGSGIEARIDGRLGDAGFAQPSGIVSDGSSLFVADSESNIIRAVGFAKGTVETLVGGDLFVFGDADGTGDSVRLQHPLGIELSGGKVLVADTYNHKIKILDPEKRMVSTFAGTGKPGQADGLKASFYEPGGISAAAGKLFVADTNNNAIRVIDLKTKEALTLKIEGLTPPVEAAQSAPAAGLRTNEIKLESSEISADREHSLIVDLSLPDGFHLNPNAPQRFEVSASDGKNVVFGSPAGKFTQLPLQVPFNTLGTGTAAVTLRLTIYFCREDNTGVCFIRSLAWQVPLRVVKASTLKSRKIELSAAVFEQ